MGKFIEVKFVGTNDIPEEEINIVIKHFENDDGTANSLQFYESNKVFLKNNQKYYVAVIKLDKESSELKIEELSYANNDQIKIYNKYVKES